MVLSRAQFVVFFLMMLQWDVGVTININVTDGGYRNVVIAIGNDLEQEKCQTYVSNIKAMINDASTLLHAATENRMYFSEVTILVPSTWTYCGEEHIYPSGLSPLTFEDVHIRVEKSHPVFFDNPWTQQPRGCGDPGDFIYLSDNFLSSSKFGSPGSVFVHEWSKFRWGVFEEYGHVGDSVYPAAYRVNETQFHPNYCTDVDVKVDYGPSCKAGDEEADCSFTPDIEQSVNMSASLLAVPFINTVNTFCNDINHVKTIPTKQNLLCDKRSTWDVIKQHDDIKNTKPSGSKGNFSYTIQQTSVSHSQNRILFLLDITKVMGEVNSRWKFVRDAVKEFIKEIASDGLEVGVLTFGNSPPSPTNLVVLNSTNRDALAAKVPEKITSIDTVKNVASALSVAAEVLQYAGKIVLITENLVALKENPNDLRTAANGFAVQPILYPAEEGISADPYNPVADVANLIPQVVKNDIDSKYQNLTCFVSITSFIQAAVNTSLTTIASSIISEWPGPNGSPVEINVKDASDYGPEFYIEVLLAYPASGDFVVTDPAQITTKIIILNGKLSITIKGSELRNGLYKIQAGQPTGPTIQASIVSTVKNSSQPFSVTISASRPLNELTFKDIPPSAPVIYAMLSDGTRPVVFAEVNATINNVLSSGGQNTINLKLWDNGVGGDVTGNDGIYSSYLVGVQGEGTLTFSISTSDNNGQARIVSRSTASNSAPVNPEGSQSACCGSSIILPDDKLVDTGGFSVVSPPGIRGKAIGTFPKDNMYPPGRVTDLKGIRNGNVVNFTFTATGEDFNIGQASFYNLKNLLDEESVHTINNSIPAGEVMSTTLSVTCNKMHTFIVEAVDIMNNPSNPSNEVNIIYSCVPGTRGLTAGAIAGITIGCIIFVIILIVILCGCFYPDSKAGQCVRCKCYKKKNKTKNRNIHLVTSRTARDNVIRTNPKPPQVNNTGHIQTSNSTAPVQGLGDLYNRSTEKEDSDSDGGFQAQQRTQNYKQTRNVHPESSEESSVVSYNPRHFASNQVGVPLANSPAMYAQEGRAFTVEPQRPHSTNHSNFDNRGYNDSENGAYSVSQSINYNKKKILPPIPQPRHNTQV